MTLILPARLESSIASAVEAIRVGGLVAFPTETVYGLGANALDRRAVRKIFKAKGRPADNPLIVHVADVAMAERVAHVTPRARRLMKKFWPGPLTIVVRRRPCVPDEVTAGLETVAIRMPSHPVALRLIRESGLPIAAPSANRAGRPSPTRASHVRADLRHGIDFILDGGASKVGIESTVVDLSVRKPVILRPGKVSESQVLRVLGERSGRLRNTRRPRAPGMKYRHYSPKAKLILVVGPASKARAEIRKRLRAARGRSVWLDFGAVSAPALSMGRSLADVARRLFAVMRAADERGIEVIYIRSVPEVGLGVAIMNRLRKAAREILSVT